MRKDVKLGFTIGGILLTVLIVYVLVVPEREPSDVQLVDADGKPMIAAPTPAETNATSSVESDGASATLIPSDVDTQEIPRGGVASATVETPSDPASPANPSDVDWDALLGGGEVLMTSTPVVPGPRAEVQEAPTANHPIVSNAVEPVVNSIGMAPSSPTTRPMSAGISRTHTVRSGETLSSISKAAYGSPNYYPHILEANPGLNANRLKVGATITLPPIDRIAPAGVADPAKPIDVSSEYRVQSGDSLYSISMRLYGSAERMSEIYELNKQAIGADPSKLKLNMVLKLPAVPTRTASR